ncbi:hypothetical protein [Paracoccus sulfuroxidans]|uniref:Uncharacterized protein n=1 Tax=Paracoccus sulfuroxidans TaxID=384678 RepID=A0A562NB79_9RHOB|nr:hypothetical protein [Paracoccus sulfuroxidans]TWI29425.1 hypothetical protein IQ24_03635 [Paracoccus sulfuroxidans]
MRDDGSDDQKKILEFMAGLMGMDPDDATVDSVSDMSNFDNDGEASAPEKTSDDDPNNLDNH